MSARDVLLYRAHADVPAVRREVARLCQELPDIDVVILGYGTIRPIFAATTTPVVMLDHADLSGLPYDARLAFLDLDKPIGANDLPVLWFYRQNPHYEHYWIAEYDVRYTGNWRDLIDELAQSRADLLATTIRDHADDPAYPWWPSLVSPGPPLPDAAMTWAFMPFCRASRLAMKTIDAASMAGWCGHAEVVWPTVLRHSGCTLEDIGGDGSYTHRDRRGRHYSSTSGCVSMFPGTFVFRPAFRDDDFFASDIPLSDRPMLWHPVK